MMNPFFCLLCSRTSFLDERFSCIHCGNGLGSRSVVADNFNLPIPEPENASPGCHVTATNAGNKKSQEYLKLLEPLREANTHMFEENSNFPLQIDERNGYENCSKSDGTPQNKTSHAFDQYNNENQNRHPANSNTNEGEFRDRFYDVCYPGTLVEAVYDTPAALQQTYLSEESSVTECENKNSSYEFLRRQGTEKHTERGIKSDSFVFTDSNNLESECPAVNLLSDSSDKVEDRHDKDDVPPPFSSCPRGIRSVNKSFQENLATANTMAEQKHKASSGVSKRLCEKCGEFFMKEWTFSAHMPICKVEDRHDKDDVPAPFSSCPRGNPSVNKYFQENLLTSKTVKQKNPQTSYNKKMTCRKCRRFFMKDSTFSAHLQNYCNPRKPYKCGDCGEIFRVISKLLVHQTIHTDEKPFKWNQCDYASARPGYLKNHMKKHAEK